MKAYRLIPLAALLPALLTACTPAESSVQASVIRPVKLFEVAKLEGGDFRTFPARVSANSRAELSFRISGQLTELALVEGQSVNQGSLLAKLDDRDAYNNLMTREADHELLAADFQRKTELLKRKLISQAEFDSAKQWPLSLRHNLFGGFKASLTATQTNQNAFGNDNGVIDQHTQSDNQRAEGDQLQLNT